jgi:uncharacterized SAM-binding protein YcdF (DUF218 family)
MVGLMQGFPKSLISWNLLLARGALPWLNGRCRKDTRAAMKSKMLIERYKKRPLLPRTLITLGAILFIGTAVSLVFYNFNFGIVLFLIVSLFLILYGAFYEKLVKKRWLTVIIFAFIAFFVVMMIAIGAYGENDNVTHDEDAVIVFGAGIRGEQISPTLARRLDKAIEYISVNPNAVIVVSGGQGPQEDITEALAMERYLLEHGVQGDGIIKEEASTSTYENLSFSKEILDRMFDASYKTVIITNEFHIYRGTKLAEKVGLETTHYHSKTEWYSVPLNYSRECIAILKLWILSE